MSMINCSYIRRFAILMSFLEPLGSSRNCLESIEILDYVPSFGMSFKVFMLEQYAMLFDVEIFLKLMSSAILILSGFIYSFFKN
jgi:hypothetical protein